MAESPEIFAEIRAEASRIEEDATYSSCGHFEASKPWAHVNLWLGIPVTLALALFSAILGVIASLVPYPRWGLWYLCGILVVDVILLYACMKAVRCISPEEVKVSGASMLLKAGMFASLVVFALSAVFLQSPLLSS